MGLEIENVGVRFGSFEALRSVNLTVDDGAFVTLLGPSGCGKTTLLNVIAGFLKPTSGTVRMDGMDISDTRPEARDTAMCFQSYALFPHLSVRENVAFGPRQKKVPKNEIVQRVSKLLDQMGLDIHAEKLPNALSGGQQQRVALARALAVAPGIVLFDEPLSNLDAKLRDQVRTEIRALQREVGFTAVYVTHDQAEALAMSDEVFLLNKGVVEQSGAPREIYFRPRTSFVADFIGAANLHVGKIKDGAMATPFGPLGVRGADALNKTVCWRPEVVRLGGDLQGAVTASAFQGGHLDLFVSAGDQTVRLQVPGSHEFDVGDEVSFGLDPENVVVLADEGHVDA
ncbi:ABC transporter ATP-binding protein [Primorskyibacter aestuariivivens]|uniref:ABC transporter ATP-binding protein n=1 Tax=Primorskyibacter aestuariivivens TaxID=1888912 RepID=UPI0023005EA6|nr:ABC transporter ATP-binding protein [Primorskyibacter aestuariivivens]MDA7430635.1 ABC transporter ATP-binding protein [Primorskyibacter aestuariivivens]